MKHLIFFFLCSFSIAAQTGYKTASLDNDGKELWDVAKPDIANSGYKYYIRYEYGYRVVNLYANDSLNFEGFVVHYLSEYKNSKTSDYVYDVTPLPKESCTIIGKKILAENFYNLPTDDSIPGYKKGYLDCWSAEYTFKIGSKIFEKHYACPEPQMDSIAGVKILKENLKLIDSILQLEKIESEFHSRIKKGEWYYNGYGNFYIKTKEQKIAWDNYKPQSDYLKSKKDTIDSLLKYYIATNYQKEGRCFEEFYLKFSKKGKLKKIDVYTPYWERIFDKDYRRCRRQVKKLFRKFDLKELKLEYCFTRRLDFGTEDEPYIYDPTSYHD